MANRSRNQVHFVVALGMLLVGSPAAGLSIRVSYHDLFELADVVAIATPIQRNVLDPAAFRALPGGDSIPVTSVEARFRIRRGLKGVTAPDTVLTMRYYLHRETPGLALWRAPSGVVMGDECGSFDRPIDSPVDFKPEDNLPYLMFLKWLGGERYKPVDGVCPSYCIQALAKE